MNIKQFIQYLNYVKVAFPESLKNAGIYGSFVKMLFLLWIPFTNLVAMEVALIVMIFLNMIVGAKAAIKTGEKFVLKKFFYGFMEHFLVGGTSVFVGWLFEEIAKINFPYDKFYFTGIVTLMVCFFEVSCMLKNGAKGWPKYTYLGKLSGITHAWEDTLEDKAKNMPNIILNTEKTSKDEDNK